MKSNSLFSSRSNPLRRLADAIRITAILVLAAGLAACGDDAGSLAGGAGASGSGSVGVFLTDAPSDEFDEILVTVNSIELLGGGPRVSLFSGSETIDLKQLEKFSDLFVYADRVPARTFSKLHMAVSRIQLVEDDEVIEVKPGGHKIDFLPREKFEVPPGGALMLEIDMDADKMLKKNGKGDYRFSPVVFVNILEAHSPAKLGRIHGVIYEFIGDNSFELCTNRFMATPLRHHDEDGEDGEDGGLGDRRKCFTVIADADTGIFDENGDPLGFDQLGLEDEATVIGRLRLLDANGDNVATPLGHDDDSDSGKGKGKGKDGDSDTDSDTDSDSDTDGGGRPKPPDFELVIDAITIELGPAGNFLQLGGVVESEVDLKDLFDFGIAPGQGYEEGTVVSALLQDGTRIFSTEGEELDASEILPDTLAKIDGIFSASDPSLYKTTLLLLDVMLLEIDQLSGTIVEPDPVTRTLTLVVIDSDSVKVEECVYVTEEADILRLTEGEDARSLTERIGFEDLAENAAADVYGGFDEEDCFTADLVVTEAAETEPEPGPEPTPL